MKKQDRKKLASLKTEELKSRLTKEQQEAVKLKMQKEAGKLKDLHAYAKKRKEIAFIATLLRNKELYKKTKT